MKLTVILAALALACVASNAEARPRKVKPVAEPCFLFCAMTSVKPRPSQHAGKTRRNSELWGNPTIPSRRFIRGRLVCARNVNAELARRGIRGTGSALAKSFLHWGRPSGPVTGAVAVFNRGKRGGHVAIVHHVDADGTVYYLNPSSRRQAWQIGPYHKKPIAFRVAAPHGSLASRGQAL